MDNILIGILRIVVLALLVIGTLAIAYFGYMNRASTEIFEKLLPAAAIGVLVALFTLWFSLKEEVVELSFPATYIIHRESGQALDRYDENFEKYYTTTRVMLMRRYLKPIRESESKVSIENNDWASDYLFLEALALIFSPFQENRDTLGTTTAGTIIDPNLKNFKNQFLRWEVFYERNKKNLTPEIIKYYSQLEKLDIPGDLAMTHVCFPKGTSITINCHLDYSGPELPYRAITIKNKFCELDIMTSPYIGFNMGLREWMWILGYDEEKDKEFNCVKSYVKLSAKFNKMRSGHPDMPKYKKWANSIFDRLKYLDSKQQLEAAREKYQLHKDSIDNPKKQ